MKFGYMIDGPFYEPYYINATCLTDAITNIENKIDIVRLARKKVDPVFIEIWEDKGIERSKMSFEDIKNVYRSYPHKSGKLLCNELCETFWHGLCREGEFTGNYFNALTYNMYGFSAGTQVNAIFDWLDKHYTGGVQELVYGNPYTVHPEEYFVPCKYISVWDGFGEVESYAKYDPVNHEVYDVEIADLTVEELSECEIFIGEYMELFGKRFSRRNRK